MDDARKNRVYNEIISGIKFIYIEGSRYKLSLPTRGYRLLAEDIYDDVVRSLRFDNLMTDIQCKQALMKLEIWSPLDDASLKKLEDLLEDQKVRLYKSLLDVNAQKRIKKQLSSTKNAINRSLSRKHALEPVTLSFHASTVKTKFLIAMGLINENGDAVYDEKSFWNSDSTVLEKVYEVVQSSIITIEEYRHLARNEPWRGIWSAAKDKVFGTVAADWTEAQKNIVSFSRMYDGAYQSPEWSVRHSI